MKQNYLFKTNLITSLRLIWMIFTIKLLKMSCKIEEMSDFFMQKAALFFHYFKISKMNIRSRRILKDFRVPKTDDTWKLFALIPNYLLWKIYAYRTIFMGLRRQYVIENWKVKWIFLVFWRRDSYFWEWNTKYLHFSISVKPDQTSTSKPRNKG